MVGMYGISANLVSKKFPQHTCKVSGPGPEICDLVRASKLTIGQAQWLSFHFIQIPHIFDMNIMINSFSILFQKY